MRKLLIVDDERHIREGLTSIVRDAKTSFKSILVAGSVSDAMETLEQEQIDLVITDIRMPKGTGVDLMEFLGRQKPRPRVVVISGYDEFEYAQRAIEHGAKAFLLKPIRRSALVQILQRIQADMDYADREAVLRREGRDARLAAYVRESCKESEVLHWVRDEIGFDLDIEEYQVLVFHQRTNALMVGGHYEGTAIDISGAFRESPGSGVAFSDGSGHRVAIVLGRDKQKQLQSLEGIMEQQDLHAGISEVGTGTGELPTMYRQALSSLRYRLLDPERRMHYFDEDARRQEPDESPALVIQRLIALLGTGKPNELTPLLSELFCVDTPETVSMDYIEMVSRDLAKRLFDEVVDNLPSWKKHASGRRARVENLYSSPTVRDHVSEFKNLLLELDRYIVNLGRQYPRTHVIDLALMYIRDNYANTGLSMTIVAEHVHLNYSYFSYLFKDQVKTGFVEYLGRVRVEHAKELLRTTNLRIQEVARRVGFLTTKNFRKVFAQNTGCVPQEYRSRKTTGAEPDDPAPG